MGIFEAFQEQLGSERNADPRRQHFLNTRMCYPPLIVTSMNMSNDSLSIASLNLEAFKLIAHGQYGQSVRLLEAAVRALHTEVRCVNLSNNDVEQIQNETFGTNSLKMNQKCLKMNQVCLEMDKTVSD